MSGITIAQVIINDSSDKTINGAYVFDRENGGSLAIPALSYFPLTPSAGEIIWRIDTRILYRRNDENTEWQAIDTANPHSTSIANIGSGTLAQLNSAISDSDVLGVSLASTAQGDILYHNGTSWVNLGAGTSGYYLKTQGIGANPKWDSIAISGGVTGPASSTDNAVARFDLATGKIIQNSSVTIDDSGNISTPGLVDGYDLSSKFQSISNSLNNIAMDHGGLTGLGDDDHTQYLLVNGTRSMSGSLNMGGFNITSIGTVDGYNLESKFYTTDSHIANISNPHGTSIANIGSGTLAQLNSAISDADVTPTTRQVIAGNGLTGGGDFSTDKTINIAAGDSSITVNADSIQVGVISDTNHGTRGGGTTHSIATTTTAGFESAADKAKLDAINLDGYASLTHHTYHENNGSDEINVAGLSGLLADVQKISVKKNSSLAGSQTAINFIEGSNVSLTVTNDTGNGNVDVRISATGGTGGVSGTLSQVLNNGNATDGYDIVISNGDTLSGSGFPISVIDGLNLNNYNIINIGTVDGYNLENKFYATDSHIANISNPHLTSIANIGSGTLAQLNTAVSDADVANAARTITAGNGLTGGGDLTADRTIAVAAGDSSITINADSIQVGVISDTNHGTRGGGTTHADATTSVSGFMSGTDKTKLNTFAPTSSAQGDILYHNGTSWVNLGAGTSGYYLKTQGSAANPTWAAVTGFGDLFGPASSTDNAIARFDLATGKIIQNSSVTIDDSGNISTPGLVDGYDLSSKFQSISNSLNNIAMDHGGLTGLGDDDHTQYLLVNGTRSMSGSLDIGGFNITNVGLVDGYNLETKFYTIDSHIVNTSNPHNTSIANIGGGTLAQLNSAISDADITTTARQVIAGNGLTGGGDFTADRTIAVAAGDTSITVNADSIQVGVISDTNHGTRGGGTTHADATTSVSGFMSGTDKTKLNTFAPTTPAQGDILYHNGTSWVNLGAGTSGYYLKTQGAAANPVWAAVSVSGTGDVTGPASSTDNAVARFDLTTGKIIQNSSVTIDDSGNIATTGTVDGVDVSALGSTVTSHTGNTSNPHSTSIANIGGGTLAQLNTAVSDADVANAARTITAGNGLTGGGDLTTDRTIAVAAGDSSITINADSIQVGVISDTNHGTRGGGTTHADATTSVSGFMSGADKTKLNTFAPTTPAQGDILYHNGTSWVNLGAGTSGYYLKTQGSAANPTWAAVTGTGDVVGPASATDNAVARFDLTTGKIIQSSTVTIDDSGNIATTGTVDGVDVSALGSTVTSHTGNTSNPHSTSIANIGGGTLAQLNTAISDADVANAARTITAGNGLTGGGDLTTDRTVAVAAGDSSITVNADSIQVGVISDTNHGTRGGGTTHADATTSVSGFMSGTDKTKLNTFAPTTPAQGDILYHNGTSWVNLGAGTSGYYLKTQGAAANPVWAVVTASGGDVTGPASSTDNAVARFDLTTGKIIQNSAVTIDDSGNITTSGTVDGVDVSTLSSTVTSHTGSTSNPHSTSIANIGGGTLAQLNTAVSDADVANAARTITAGAGLTGGGDLTTDRTVAVAAGDSSITVNADSIQVGVISDTNHGTRGGGTTHAEATTSVAGFMPAADKTKVDLIVSNSHKITITATAPTSPSTGDIWIDIT